MILVFPWPSLAGGRGQGGGGGGECFDVPEDTHQGGIKMTLCRNLGEKRGRAYFRRGHISGTLRYTV